MQAMRDPAREGRDRRFGRGRRAAAAGLEPAELPAPTPQAQDLRLRPPGSLAMPNPHGGVGQNPQWIRGEDGLRGAARTHGVPSLHRRPREPSSPARRAGSGSGAGPSHLFTCSRVQGSASKCPTVPTPAPEPNPVSAKLSIRCPRAVPGRPPAHDRVRPSRFPDASRPDQFLYSCSQHFELFWKKEFFCLSVWRHVSARTY
jgi:hypothetical protein